MTDFTRTFIPVANDAINATNFAETTQRGSRDAARFAREDACQLAGLLDKFVNVSPLLWGAMKGDMRRVVSDTVALAGVAMDADLTHAGYSAEVVARFAAANVVGGADRENDRIRDLEAAE